MFDQSKPTASGPSLGRKAVHFLVGLGALTILGTVGLVAVSQGSAKFDEVPASGADAAHSELESGTSRRGTPPVGAPTPAPDEPTTGSDLGDFRDSVAELQGAAAKEKLDGQTSDALVELIHRLAAADREGTRLLSARRAGLESAVIGLFQISGKIQTRDADLVSVWGHALPNNSDLGQLGAHVEEANLVVMSPDPESLSSGVYYLGTHAFVRTSTGTNAFGGPVPVSVYGPVSRAASDRQSELQQDIADLEGLRKQLGTSMARARRALVATKGIQGGQEASDPITAERFVQALFEFDWDESAFVQPGASMPCERWVPERRPMPGDRSGEVMSGLFLNSGAVVRLNHVEMEQVTRIHSWKRLADYLPGGLRDLFAGVVDQPLPPGEEGLVNLLTDEKQLASTSLSQNFGFKLLQSQRMPELISVTIFAHGYSKVRLAELLCLWTGNRTIVLTSALCRNSSPSPGTFALDLGAASVDPLAMTE